WHLAEAPVPVLPARQVADRAAGAAAAPVPGGGERLEAGAGHVEVGARPRSQAEAAVRLLRPLEPRDGARAHRPAGRLQSQDAKGGVAHVARDRPVRPAVRQHLADEVAPLEAARGEARGTKNEDRPPDVADLP